MVVGVEGQNPSHSWVRVRSAQGGFTKTPCGRQLVGHAAALDSAAEILRGIGKLPISLNFGVTAARRAVLRSRRTGTSTPANLRNRTPYPNAQTASANRGPMESRGGPLFPKPRAHRGARAVGART